MLLRYQARIPEEQERHEEEEKEESFSLREESSASHEGTDITPRNADDTHNS